MLLKTLTKRQNKVFLWPDNFRKRQVLVIVILNSYLKNKEIVLKTYWKLLNFIRMTTKTLFMIQFFLIISAQFNLIKGSGHQVLKIEVQIFQLKHRFLVNRIVNYSMITV